MPAALEPCSRPLPRQTLYFASLPEVEAVAEETSAWETNRLLRSGWCLLQVIHCHDSGGGYVLYVVGRLRTVSVDARCS